MGKLYGAIAISLVFIGMAVTIKLQSLSIESYKTIAEQSAGQLKMCVEQYSKNQEISDEYKENIDTLRDNLDAIKLHDGDKCVPIAPPAPRGGGGAERGYVQETSLPLGKLLDYGAKCEQIRLQLKAAQAYIGGRHDTFKNGNP
jgi:hypothetical protein